MATRNALSLHSPKLIYHDISMGGVCMAFQVTRDEGCPTGKPSVDPPTYPSLWIE